MTCTRPVWPSDVVHGNCPACGHTLDLHPNEFTGTGALTQCLVCEVIELRDTLKAVLASSSQTT